MCSVTIEDLGNRLRQRRTAAGRTIASVAVDAGLSVPYIANLENGRGNPTLAAIARLATALGARLSVELAEPGSPAAPDSPVLPDSLVQFSRLRRFADEADRLAASAGASPVLTRERLLAAMAGLAALAGRPLAELDWHRILDTVVLLRNG
jgi:transcriptional regulator with XRE-family HTH domain